jgi:hypothetical protein
LIVSAGRFSQRFYLVHCNHFGKMDETDPVVFLPAEIREDTGPDLFPYGLKF